MMIMVWILPEWLSDLVFIAIGVGIGYQYAKYKANPKKWIREWFD
ncbi:hypothetical protein ABC633_00060 [Lentilactobacillus parabuchneri]